MHTFSKILLILALSMLIGCSTQNQEDNTWDAILLGIPEYISPSVADINMGIYILKQTHKPMFEETEKGLFDSKLLREWKRNSDYTEFKLCPNRNFHFTENQPFDSAAVISTLGRAFSENLVRKVSVTKDDCVLISFNKSIKNFFAELSKFSNAPSVQNKDKKWDNGLGEFQIVSKTTDRLKLKRKNKKRDSYHFIEFHNWTRKSKSLLFDRTIEDFNRVLLKDLPEWISVEFDPYSVPLLQTVNLVLNSKSLELRKFVRNCIDIIKLRRAFMVGQEKFFDVSTILPLGMPGSKVGLAKQECSNLAAYKEKNIELVFANWNSDNFIPLQNYFSSFHRKTGIKIRIVNYELNEYLKILFKENRPFDLTILALDAVTPDFEAFFGPLLRRPSVTDFEFPEIFEMVKSADDDFDTKLKLPKIRRALEEIENESIILPLYQEVRTFYYPKHLRQIFSEKDLLEYPEVAKVKF